MFSLVKLCMLINKFVKLDLLEAEIKRAFIGSLINIIVQFFNNRMRFSFRFRL